MEQGWPEALVDGFDHLDRHDLVVHCLLIAEVLDLDVGRVRQSCTLEPSLGIRGLFRGQRQTRHVDTVMRCGMFDESTPTTPDLKHAVPGCQLKDLAESFVLPCLRGREILILGLEQGGRVRHRGVEPCRIEVVPEVVVIPDRLDDIGPAPIRALRPPLLERLAPPRHPP